MSISRWKSFVVLVTPQYAILVLFNLLSASLILAHGALPFRRIALLAVSFVTGIFFLNALNQIAEIDLDRLNKPGRPLPSGAISLREAKTVTVLLCLTSLCASAALGLGNVLVMSLFLAVAVEYSCPPVRLRRSWIGACCVGALLLGALPVIATALAFHRSIDVPSAFLFAGLVWALTVTKDLEDVSGDRAFGLRTIPVRFGKEFALNLVAAEILALLLAVFVCAWLGVCFGRQHLYSSSACVPLVLWWRRYAGATAEESLLTQGRAVTAGMLLIGLVQLLHALAALV